MAQKTIHRSPKVQVIEPSTNFPQFSTTGNPGKVTTDSIVFTENFHIPSNLEITAKLESLESSSGKEFSTAQSFRAHLKGLVSSKT